MYGINILEYRNLKFNGMGLDLVITSFTNSTFTLQLKLLVKVCYGLFYEIMVIERKKMFLKSRKSHLWVALEGSKQYRVLSN